MCYDGKVGFLPLPFCLPACTELCFPHHSCSDCGAVLWVLPCTHIHCQQLLSIVNTGNSDFSLAHVLEIVGVGGDMEEICRYTGHLWWHWGRSQRKEEALTELSPALLALTNELWLLVGHYLIKNMIASFTGQLESHSGFLQKI